MKNDRITSSKIVSDIRIHAYCFFFVGILGILACIVIFSFGATVLILGKTSTGVFTTVVSSVSTVPFVRMVKTAHNWLEVARKQLENS